MTDERPPWDLSFLRVGALVTAAAAAIATPLGGWLGGWGGAAGVLLGAVLVAAFFAVSGFAVAAAGRIGDTLVLPVALLAFGLKAMLLFAVLSAVPEEGWLDRRTVAWSIVVGALLWTGVHARWVLTRQLFYVPPPSPPPPGTDPEGSAPRA